MEIASKYRKIALLNLATVAVLGLVLRLKLTIPMPWIEHRYLLNAHSHFAFIGWVGYALALMTFSGNLSAKKYSLFQKWYLRVYAWNAWFMIPAFLFFGYTFPGYFLLTIHIGLSCLFIWWWRKVRKENTSLIRLAVDWALFFNILSFIGPLILAIMKANQWGSAYDRQNAIYIFLHYQYNGYFLLMCLAIFSFQFGAVLKIKRMKLGIWVYAISIFTGIGLIWLLREKPLWLHTINFLVAAGIVSSAILLAPPMAAAFRSVKNDVSNFSRMLWVLCMVGCVLKAILQSLSSIPQIAYLVYEHRSIAIGYLHLVFLIMVSFFLLGIFYYKKNILTNMGKAGIFIFILGAIINEIFLGMQGAGAIMNVVFTDTDIWLVAAAFLLATGSILIAVPEFKKYTSQ